MNKIKYRSKLDETMHEMAKGLFNEGIMDEKTMREFDVSCIKPVKPNSTAKPSLVPPQDPVKPKSSKRPG
ncbi:MAG: hypothetical protein JST65_19785 [Acidobacteria bacterium]|nr:hypothetical protein [Acidobacteriota bacterium]